MRLTRAAAPSNGDAPLMAFEYRFDADGRGAERQAVSCMLHVTSDTKEVMRLRTNPISAAILRTVRAVGRLQTYRQGVDLDAILETFLGGIASPEAPSTQSTPRPEPGADQLHSQQRRVLRGWRDSTQQDPATVPVCLSKPRHHARCCAAKLLSPPYVERPL